MRGLAIAVVLFLVGCPEQPRPAEVGGLPDTAGTPPTLELGTGEASFVAIVDGGEAELVHGPQGGYHVVVASRLTGLDPDNTVLTYTAVDGAATLVTTPIAILTRRLVREGVSFLKLGDFLILPISGPPDIVGHTIEIRAVLSRDGTTVAMDTLTVMVVDRI